MAIQTDNLVMAALAAVSDHPPNLIQPPLANGIHLRFAFAPEIGFPWGGFFLFRRLHQLSDHHCLSPQFKAEWKPGPWPSNRVDFAGGSFTSDLALIFLDQFEPAASPEFDLQNRKYLRFDLPLGASVREFHVRLGLLGKKGTGQLVLPKKCVDFTQLKATTYPNPYLSNGIQFTFYDVTVPKKNFIVSLFSGSGAAVIAQTQVVVQLPVRASSVEIDSVQLMARIHFSALDAAGNVIDQATASPDPTKQVQTVRLSGGAVGIVTVKIDPSGLESYLVRFCYTELPQQPLLGPIRLRALDGQVPVTETSVSGHVGEIVTALLSGDRMTSVEIEGGPAALIDICTVGISQDLPVGWNSLVDYPICLPVEHADYPCPGKPATFTDAENLALSRIHYGPPAKWAGQNFADLNNLLKDLVVHGPAGGPMNLRTRSYPPSSASSDAPSMPDQYPLEIALLGSLHPAVAMMLGLYWIDSTALPGVSYDYMVMADHGGRFHGSPSAALSALSLAMAPGQAPLPYDVDLWVTFGKKLEAAPPLAPPAAPFVYALPGAITGGTNAPASSLPILPLGGRNMAGLSWQINAAPDGSLLPGGAIGCHLWRANLGSNKPSGPPPSEVYNLLTTDRLILATDTTLPGGSAPERATDWPPFALMAFDPGLPDGWYSYCLSAVDIFGRHSVMGAAGPWHQWSPPPSPKPWYYIDPPADRQVNAFAVELLDKTPPPRVPGVEADALDPEDRMLVRDAAFITWWTAIESAWWNLSSTDRDKVLPLRVRWKWSASQMIQAPDTKEFRIYFNPGTLAPAPDNTDPTNWHDRIYVVDYNHHFSPTTDEDGLPLRQYEVLLPVPNDPNDPAFPGVPLAPSEANPIVYAHVSVSAADDKQHTADNPKWKNSAWGNRAGNEGQLGASAKILRVLRSKPPAPTAVDDSDKVLATRADYHSDSYYTVRWPRNGTLRAHLFRSLDNTLFQFDWQRRKSDATLVSSTDPSSFPIPSWDLTTRGAVAAELNGLVTLSNSTSFDKTVRAAYAALSNKALRTLAGLAGNEAAFSQITYLPLDPADPGNADRRGQDGVDGYLPGATLCAYTAKLDGRATNRYFFRAAYVNAAHTVGPLGPSSPVVYLPKVEPPRIPVITKVVSGDRSITLTWALNREPDLADYRVYRTTEERKSRDIRLMDRVTTISLANVDISKPGCEWTDTGALLGGRKFFYRLTATDTSGNESAPSQIAAAVVVDTATPPAPVWTEQTWLLQRKSDSQLFPWPLDGIIPSGHRPVLQLGWQSETPQARFVVTRQRRGERDWTEPNATVSIKPSDPNTFVLVDPDADPTFDSLYRLEVCSSSGVWATEEAIIAVTLPNPPASFASGTGQ